jgi:hypothetical protein
MKGAVRTITPVVGKGYDTIEVYCWGCVVIFNAIRGKYSIGDEIELVHAAGRSVAEGFELAIPEEP